MRGTWDLERGWPDGEPPVVLDGGIGDGVGFGKFRGRGGRNAREGRRVEGRGEVLGGCSVIEKKKEGDDDDGGRSVVATRFSLEGGADMATGWVDLT